MTDGITYKAGKAFKHFTSERAAIYFTGLTRSGITRCVT